MDLFFSQQQHYSMDLILTKNPFVTLLCTISLDIKLNNNGLMLKSSVPSLEITVQCISDFLFSE